MDSTVVDNQTEGSLAISSNEQGMDSTIIIRQDTHLCMLQRRAINITIEILIASLINLLVRYFGKKGIVEELPSLIKTIYPI